MSAAWRSRESHAAVISEGAPAARRLLPRYLVVAVLAALLSLELGAEIRTTAWLAGPSRAASGIVGPAGVAWDVTLVRERGGVAVEAVEPNSPAERTGLRSGDLIVSVNGVSVAEHPETYFRAVAGGKPGDAVTLRWRRAGPDLTGVLTLSRRATVRAAESPWVRYGPYLLPPLLMLLMGAWIGFARARDRSALEVAVLLLVLGQALSVFIERTPTLAVWPLWAIGAAVGASRLAIYPLALLAVWVLGAFPSPSPLGTWLRKRNWILVPYALLSLESVFEATRRLHGASLLPDGLAAALDRLVPWTPLWLALLIIAVVLIVAQRAATRGRREARLGVVEAGLIGTVLGGVWVLFLWSSATFWGVVEAPEGVVLSAALRAAAVLVPILLLCALPLSLAYAVVARRVFGIRVILRQGIRYVLLSRGVLLLEGVLLFLILGETIHLSRREEGASVPALTAVAGVVTVLVILALLRVNRPLMRAIDRRFFRESYDARRLLLELGQEMLTLRERQDVLRRSGTALLETLHATRVGFYLRDGASGEARLVWQVAAATHDGAESAPTGPIEEGLAAFEDGGYSWDIPATGARASSPDGDAPFELLIALRGNTALLGCIALGAKRSGEPYGRDDRETLATVAAQVGLALENAVLLDIAKREAEQAREISIARRVQQRLFPSSLPAPEGWEFAAVCRPARAVGGDYYDVLAPDPQHVVVALGDVCGKGLGPSLVMSGIQALIRSRFRRSSGSLTELASELNEHILGSSSSGTFVTLFVGVFDTASGRLRYVNAGHNPPVVIASDGAEQLLAEGGTPAGMLEGASYVEGQASMEPGSTLVLYSDGVTEARDRSGEFYGEKRLSGEVLAARGRGAAEILAAILASVDRFAQGEEQADDLSLLVVRRRP